MRVRRRVSYFFADFGDHITCIDKDIAKIASLRRGKIPFFEPGLNRLVATNAAAGRLEFDTDLSEAVSRSDAVFIAVGTPTFKPNTDDMREASSIPLTTALVDMSARVKAYDPAWSRSSRTAGDYL